MASAFDHLPEAVRRLLPELAHAWPEERRADCARCPQVAAGAFHPETRCCTAHPSMANFLVGGALRRGGVGRARVLARLDDPAGVSAWGIDAPDDFDRRYVALGDDAFGRELTLRCPYWVGGAESCGVWHDRSALCRTWYCKHEAGLRGAVEWTEAGALLGEVESRLAWLCIGAGAPPADAPAPAPADWTRWFEWCSAHVERLDDAAVAALATPALAAKRGELVALRRRPRRALPDVVVPAVRDRADVPGEPDMLLLSGYSTYDAIRAPRAVFGFLALLDGERTWRDALAAAPAADGLDAALVAELYRVGALESREGSVADVGIDVDFVPSSQWAQRGRYPDGA